MGSTGSDTRECRLFSGSLAGGPSAVSTKASPPRGRRVGAAQSRQCLDSELKEQDKITTIFSFSSEINFKKYPKHLKSILT